MVMFGCYLGCCYFFLNFICIILVGVSNLVIVYGFVMFFMGIGCFIGFLFGGIFIYLLLNDLIKFKLLCFVIVC